jgi:hypothetical protein
MSLLSQHSFQQTQAAIKDLISVAHTAVPRHRKHQKKTAAGQKQTALVEACDCELLKVGI